MGYQRISLAGLQLKELEELVIPKTKSEPLKTPTMSVNPAKPIQKQNALPSLAQKQTPKPKSKDNKQAQDASSQVATKQSKNLPITSTQPPSFYSLNQLSSDESELKKLYGAEFYSLSKADKDFLNQNYRKIYDITNRYLIYPPVAGRLRISGTNRLEFYLHPNGNISGLKIISSSGYEILDKNSLQTIEIAYKDYPYPKKTLKMIFQINYKL
ncbi:energy transducer TonB [Helicobacter monodelphidis]|uniref:energy transducer TonB n=1 Tax=Helicobacter sp. 15-1451 TaxID=2004995 RepID=UPI0015ECD77F|nr:energy transducer TonB [Helicobacter sp. 15-1451]